MTDIAKNIYDIQKRLGIAAREGGFETPPKLIAVSKGHSRESVEAALAAGHRVFGENRVQEALEKFSGLREEYPDLEFHLIGPLQTNKAKQAAPFFDVIHTVDREKLVIAIKKQDRAIKKQNGRPKLFIQVNTGEEPQKSGIRPSDLPAFLDFCQGQEGLELEGLMCIPPLNEEPAMHFALLQKLARRHGLSGLSMGMSSDFETAAALGATHVRIGTAIFGDRLAL